MCLQSSAEPPGRAAVGCGRGSECTCSKEHEERKLVFLANETFSQG